MFPIMLALALAQGAYSAYNANKASNQLDQLDKEGRPKYQVSPELQGSYNRAEQMSGQGFTGAEKGAFRQNVAQDTNTKSQRALDIGGGSLARTISRFGTIGNLGAENKFAAQDAAQHRSNIHYADSLAKSIQGTKDRETGAGIHDYNLKEQAFGAAKSQDMSNIFSSLAMAGQYGLGGGKLSDPTMGGGVNGDGSSPIQYNGLNTQDEFPDIYRRFRTAKFV